MKLFTRTLSLLLCFAAAAPLALAADPDPKMPPPMPPGPGEAAPAPKTPVTFLGVETVPASRTLTEQLGLEPDTGLVVNMVAKDSPASAVLKQYDILTKLDDQKLIETRQLAVLVRGHKEGDEVTLTYIRGGKEATAKVKLAKRYLPDMRFHLQHLAPMEDGLHRLGENSDLPQADVDRLLPLMNMGREMQVRVVHPGPENAEEQEITTVNTSNSNLVLTDDAGTLEVKVVEGKKSVVAKNAKGEVVFSGPFNTEAERKAAPPDVRQRLDKLERMEGVRFKADADFHPGESDMVVPAAHRISYRQGPGPTPAPLSAPPLML